MKRSPLAPPPDSASRLLRKGAAALGTLLALMLPVALSSPAARGQVASKSTAPEKTDLLRSTPFDRLTLIDKTVLLIDPVSPRPLPDYDKEAARKRKEPFRPPAEGNIGLPGAKSRVIMPEEQKKLDEKASELIIHLLDGEIRDFKVKRQSIQKIEYFEDLLLAEGDRMLQAKNYAKAFECYLRAESRESNWPGITERVDRLLFEEGSAALFEGDEERGLRLLRELFVRNPGYPELADKLARAYSARAKHAFNLRLFALGRKILHDLDPLAPNHPRLEEVRNLFIQKARQLTAEATRKQGAERLDPLTEALRIWPKLDEADPPYQQAFREIPTLDVGVIDLPRPVGPWLRTPADERVSRLIYLPILSKVSDDLVEGVRSDQLASNLELSNLGRRMLISLRQDVPWSDASRPVSALDVTRAFTDRTEPASPQYNARWAEVIERVESPDPSHVEIRLTRPLVKPQQWLLSPVGPAHGGWDGRVANRDRTRQLVTDGPFRLARSTGEVLELVSSVPPADSVARLNPRRIREVRYPDTSAAIGALVRGEVSLLETIPAHRAKELAESSDLKVGRYASPFVHYLAMDGRNPVLRNRSLRRGISYAINRQVLLEENLLKRPTDELNRVADGPFPFGSAADASGVPPFTHDPLLAAMLVAAARKELETGPIKLTMEYPSIPEAQIIVPKLVEALKPVGVTLVPVERPESVLESELRSGRRFDLAYRATRCDEPVVEAGPLLCPGYDAPTSANAFGSLASPRILQLLVELERATEWPSARDTALRIDRESRDELPVIPLWQMERYFAWRTRLRGPAEVSDRLYDGIANWEIEPWYASDPW